ncbi:MAG: peptide ABC transporter [Firmicutes bacterium]|jgi:peptide/nickel transport system substrate-binding protein|nr:peptide ABC transporter [Bacillota bacterium]
MRRMMLAVVIVCLLLSAAAAAQEPKQGGVFRYALTTNPRGMFNPILNTETYDSYIISMVYDGLIYIDEQLQPQPKVAKYWEISDDGLSITFYLHEGVKFHDGVELTAHDVEYTYKTILHPEYTGVRYGNFKLLVGAEDYHNGLSNTVPGIEVIDDYTIKFTTTEPYAPFVTQFTYGILPSHLLEDIPVGELERADFNRHPIGSGPFKFVEFLTDQHVILEANDDYFFGRPNIDTLVFQRVALDALPIYIRQQRVDYAEISPDNYAEVSGIPGVDLYVYEALSYNYICFNMRQPRFADPVVRQAITYGFDRETYVEVLREGFGIVANAPIPMASWAFTDEGINEYPYNPELAAQMLAEAGWKPGPDGVLEKDDMRLEFEFLVPEGSRVTEQMALLFQQNMEDIGIKVNLVFMEFSAAVDRVDAREFDTFTMAWSLSVDPDPHGIWHSTSPWNDPGFFNERSDELIEMGRRETDLEKRKEIYAEWQRLINYELPTMFLSYGVTIAAVNERVQGIDTEPGPLGPLASLERLSTIWLAD